VEKTQFEFKEFKFGSVDERGIPTESSVSEMRESLVDGVVQIKVFSDKVYLYIFLES